MVLRCPASVGKLEDWMSARRRTAELCIQQLTVGKLSLQDLPSWSQSPKPAAMPPTDDRKSATTPAKPTPLHSKASDEVDTDHDPKMIDGDPAPAREFAQPTKRTNAALQHTSSSRSISHLCPLVCWAAALVRLVRCAHSCHVQQPPNGLGACCSFQSTARS
ncbi:unnamed protein product [Phytophthora lilii]|uniref:Unnamed protein product n=1 Tax=Phytophthora lilii TaxID=2077276 RepID=A0A9W6WUT2_9STRA|nr:unnamed protein product [Phytophthora lilii]